jgi:uncharacterized membrane protein
MLQNEAFGPGPWAPMNTLAFVRAIHVLSIVVWIGGVSMVTSVILPAVRRGELGPDLPKAFHAIERRFVWQARVTLLIVGLSGLYMLARLGLGSHFGSLQFWWLHAMICLWLLFAFMLFVGEPFILRGRFERFAERNPEKAFAWLQRAHWVLLGLSFVTIVGATAGSHGWSITEVFG